MAKISRRRGRYVVDYRDVFGRRRCPGFRTRREANECLARALREATGALRPAGSVDITVAEYSRSWLAALSGLIKPRTLESYESSLRLHILPALGHVRLRRLSRSQVKAFIAEQLAAPATAYG